MNDPTDRLLDLLDREGPSLHALLFRLTLDRHAAEDLMQELFIKLAANPAFRAATNPPAYLRQSAIHLALDWRRVRRPIPAASLPDQPDPSPDAGTTLARHEQWSRILDAATELPGLTREAFVLHYLEHLSFEEVARQLDKTPHQIRGLCHKAIIQLRGQLADLPDAGSGRGAKHAH